ncbi:MAG: mechanosensitive ion channel family protein [Myxococcota bacterium]
MKAISWSVLMVAILVGVAVTGATAEERKVKVKDLVTAPETAGATEEAAEQPAAPAPAPGPPDDFDRGVPRTTVVGFRSAAEKADWERAAEYLDVRRLPRGFTSREGPELARQLAFLLDRFLWIHPETLSAEPKGHADDGLPAYQDYVGRIEAPEKQVDILLQRVPRGDGVSIWKFATATVVEVPALFEQYGARRLGHRLAEYVPQGRFLSLPLWEWAGVLVVMAGTVLVAWIAVALLGALVGLTGQARIVSLERRLRGPLRLLLFCGVGRATIGLLGPTVGLRAILEAQTLLMVALAWLAMRVGEVMLERGAERLRVRGETAAQMLGRPARNFVRVVIVLVALVIWLDQLGVRVTTLIAGLGIGGLAVALSAQRPIEDLIGALTIYSTQPVRVGDFCRFGPNMGTVEEIGLRATRVRTLDDSIVSVPNSEFSKLHVEDLGRRSKIWYHPRIRLRYETTPDQLRCILVEIHRILYAHPRVLLDPARVRFVGFGEWSLDLDVFAYIDTTDYGEYLEIAEDLGLRIMDAVVQVGSSFAFPSQTAYVEPGRGLDEEHAAIAEERVREWREKHELYIPSFPKAAVAGLRGTLAYPPEGSAAADDAGGT